MAKIKSYTDFEQSKKLAEILPLESADMYHFIDNIDKVYKVGFEYRKITADYYSKTKLEYIPCWSLAALRNLLPVGIKINENTYLFGSHNTFDKSWVYRYYNEDDTSYLYQKDINEVDACVEMIIKLKELNLL